MANLIRRGPIEKQGRTINLPVLGALLPGIFVESDGTNLVPLTTAEGKRPLVLSNMEFKDQDINTAYADGDTGIAYEIERNDDFQCRMAAATYAANAPLTIDANSRLAAAATGDPVVAFFADTPGAFADGDFADVIIADGHAAP